MRSEPWDPNIYKCDGYNDGDLHRKGCKNRGVRRDPVWVSYFYSVECGHTHNDSRIAGRLIRCIPEVGTKATETPEIRDERDS